MTDITKHMHKNDGLENYLQKKISHPGDSDSLPGVQESGSISGRLLDDPGGFTCMAFVKQLHNNLRTERA